MKKELTKEEIIRGSIRKEYDRWLFEYICIYCKRFWYDLWDSKVVCPCQRDH